MFLSMVINDVFLETLSSSKIYLGDTVFLELSKLDGTNQKGMLGI